MHRHRILIADKNELVRKGLLAVLAQESSFEVVGEACNGEEALEKAKEQMPDLILMDIDMPKMDGVTTSKKLMTLFPETKVAMLTRIENEQAIFDSLEAGVAGYLLKDADVRDLVAAIRVILKGQSFLHPEITKKVIKKFSTSNANRKTNGVSNSLTPREMEILDLLTQGLKNKEIAAELHVSEKTVKTHVSNILRKLDQPDRIKAILYATRMGIIGIKSQDQ